MGRRGLGLAAGAVLVATLGLAALGTVAHGQVPTQPPTQPPRPAPTRADTIRDSVRATIPARPRADSSRIDSVKGIPDTLRKRVRRDSIQAPLARAEVPRSIDVRAPYRWTRDSVFSTGAVTLADLLERVPGVTVLRSGFLASAQVAAYNGDVARVRVFRDGVELESLDPRAGAIPDLADFQLGNLDEIAIEPSAGEIRVHVRSWTVRNTTPYTRVDASTGDEDSNLYRFFFGRRFGSGFDAQLGVQQFGTGARNRRTGGGGSVLDALGRFGWARGAWQADLTFQRLDRERDQTYNTFNEADSLLPPFKGRRNDAALRVGYRDPEANGLWLQGIASTSTLRLTGTSRTRVDTVGRDTVSTDTTVTPNRPVTTPVLDTTFVADSSVTRIQYVLTGGYTFGALRVSATDRLRAFGGATYNSPSARADFTTGILALTAFGERNGVAGSDVFQAPSARRNFVGDSLRFGMAGRFLPPDRTSRLDVNARLTPLRWLAIVGSISRESRSAYVDSVDTLRARTSATNATPRDTGFVTSFAKAASEDRTTARIEALVRWRRLWLSAGRVQRSAGLLIPPRIYESVGLVAIPEPSAAATVVGVRGGVWKDVYTDVTGTVWDAGGAYRPQYQLRGEVGVASNWLRRFPSGNFGFKAAIIDSYRSRTLFPVAADPDDSTSSNARFAAPSNSLDVQVEIRIQRGVLNYQLRNALNRQYELVPGFRMPGAVNFYGLRWEFWN